jgi:hypothetical protein
MNVRLPPAKADEIPPSLDRRAKLIRRLAVWPARRMNVSGQTATVVQSSRQIDTGAGRRAKIARRLRAIDRDPD